MNCYIVIGKKDKMLKTFDDIGLVGLEALISYDFDLLDGILRDNNVKGCKVIEVSPRELINYMDWWSGGTKTPEEYCRDALKKSWVIEPS